jgi:predicted Fe-Mo cluster-binding NifX family protein
MKIAISAETSSPDGAVDPRFGRAKYFQVFDDATGSWEAVDNTQNLQATQGAGIQSAANVVNAGCGALISGHCGPKAYTALSFAGIAVYTVPGGTVREAVDSLKQGRLTRTGSADVDGHW